MTPAFIRDISAVLTRKSVVRHLAIKLNAPGSLVILEDNPKRSALVWGEGMVLTMNTRIRCCSSPALLLLAGTLMLNAESIPAQDSRNVNIIDGNMHFTMPGFSSRESWQARAAEIRKQILASAGLLPMPSKTPLQPQVFGKLELEGYSVGKVLLETYPGFYLGGNLYRPLGKAGPFPAVLSPHGHWDYGRLENTPIVSIQARGINFGSPGLRCFHL